MAEGGAGQDFDVLGVGDARTEPAALRRQDDLDGLSGRERRAPRVGHVGCQAADRRDLGVGTAPDRRELAPLHVVVGEDAGPAGADVAHRDGLAEVRRVVADDEIGHRDGRHGGVRRLHNRIPTGRLPRGAHGHDRERDHRPERDDHHDEPERDGAASGEA